MSFYRKWNRSGAILALPIAVAGLIEARPAAGQKLYWADQELATIFRSNLDGSAIEPVVHSPGLLLQSVTVDQEAGVLYWSDLEFAADQSITGYIRRARLDGSNPDTIVTQPQATIASLQVDSLHGFIYWVVPRTGPRIQRCGLGGENPEVIIQPDSGIASDLTLDPIGGYLYWTNGFGRLFRARLDGSMNEEIEIFQDKLSSYIIQEVSFEPVNRELYLTAKNDTDAHSIIRAHPDGSQAIEIASGPLTMARVNFDPPSGTLYWIEGQQFPPSPQTIRRAGRSMCDAEDLISGGLENPIDLAIDTTSRPDLDIDPNGCPNVLARSARRVTSAAVIGTTGFDVLTLDPLSLRLTRADGMPGEVRPAIGDGVSVFLDVTSPGPTCVCHEGIPDGHADALVDFSTGDIRHLLRPRSDEATIGLVLRGRLQNGRPLAAADCVTRPPR